MKDRHLRDPLQAVPEVGTTALLHDLRSMLTPLLLEIDRAWDLLPEALPDRSDRIEAIADLREALDTARASGTAIQALLRRHAAQVRRDQAPHTTPVRPVIEDTLRALQTHPPLLHIGRLDDVLVGMPAGDLQRVILNLTTNAIEACVHLPTPRVTVSCVATDQVQITVEDNGPGPVQPERIFDLHWTNKTSGSGIGLYVAQQLVHRWGSTLRIERAHGRTRFVVTVPFADAQPAGAE